MQYVLCKTAENRFAIPVEQVKELVQFKEIQFRLPNSPTNILGGVTIRDQTVAVIQADDCKPPEKGILILNHNRQSILMNEEVSIETCNEEVSKFGTLTIKNQVYVVFDLSPEALINSLSIKPYNLEADNQNPVAA